ncbi:MAG: aminoacyl-tRNA hydrolase [Candidatus Omnitrophota bacterium]
MKLIVGLGNPGFRYRNTRHNIGFRVVGELSKRYKIALSGKKYNALYGKGIIDDENVALFMPQTYMNLSGDAVREVVKKKGINACDILVIYDDVDLIFGAMRLRQKGRSAGHNGLESVINSLKTSEFPRLRVGIGKAVKPQDTSEFVLKGFDADERRHIGKIVEKAADCAISWLKKGPNAAMTAFNKEHL